MIITDDIFKDFKRGELRGFYEQIYPSLIMFATRLLGNDYGFLSEDCVQESIYKTYNYRTSITNKMQMKTFLYTCIHNQAISLQRKGGSSEKHALMIQNNRELIDHNLENNIIEQETIDLLYEAISHLPEDMRQLYELNFIENKKLAEIAAITGLTESAIKKKKARMLTLLRDYFKRKDSPAAKILLTIFIG